MTAVRPWTERLLAVVEAEPGIHIEEAIRRVTPFVPQGHAYRAREKRMESQARRWRRANGLPEELPRTTTRPPKHPTEAHRIGARVVLTDAIWGLTKGGRLVRVDNSLFPAAQAGATRCTASDEDSDWEWLWV